MISAAIGAILLLNGVSAFAAEGNAPLGTYTAAERRHWAFQPRKDTKAPLFADAGAKAWIRTPIDGFVLEGLRKAGLRPAPEASRAELIRRLTFDLHGLPPTPEEIAAFVADRSSKAFENLVDKLLASPRYGEQWARHWRRASGFGSRPGTNCSVQARVWILPSSLEREILPRPATAQPTAC